MRGCKTAQLCAVQANNASSTALPPLGWCVDPIDLLRAPRCSLQGPVHHHRGRTPALLCGAHAVCVQAALPPSSTLLNIYFTKPADRATVAAVDPSHPLGGALWGSSMAGRVQPVQPSMFKERRDWPVMWPPPPPQTHFQSPPKPPAAVVYAYEIDDEEETTGVLRPGRQDAWHPLGGTEVEEKSVLLVKTKQATSAAENDVYHSAAAAQGVPQPMHRRPRQLLARPLVDDDEDSEYGWQTFRVAADQRAGWREEPLSKSLVGLHPPPSRSKGAFARVQDESLTWWQLAAQQRARQREALRKTLAAVRQGTVLLAGPPSAVLRAVRVDEWEPLGPGLPEALPSTLLGCLSMLSRVSMALALVNALPIAGLDGHTLLQGVISQPSRQAVSVGASVSLGLMLLLHVMRLARVFAHALMIPSNV